RKMLDQMIVPNGMAWGVDGRTLYHSDSRQDYVWQWDWDRATGDISNQRVYLACDALEGRLDGGAIDAEGCYWSCKIGAWHVAPYPPDGKIATLIGAPVQRPAASPFGGPNLDTLYITTARLPLSETALAKQPLAGSVFAIQLGVKGQIEHRFAG